MSGPWEKYQAGPWTRYGNTAPGMPQSAAPQPPQPSGGDWRTDYGGREGGIAPKPQELDWMMGGMAVGYGQDLTGRDHQMSTYNVSSGELPSDIRYKASFAPDEVGGYQRLLGSEYEVQRLPSEAGPIAGRTVYRKRGDVPWQTVSPIGRLSTGDVASLAGEAIPTVGGVAGGALGGLAGAPGGATSIVAGAAGAGAGAFAGEFQRLKKGQEFGVHDLNDDQIFSHALKRAGIDAGTQLGFGAAYRLYKTFARRGMPDVSVDEFRARLQEAQGAVGQAGVDPGNMRSAGVMQGTPAGSDLQAMERMVARDAPKVRRLMEQQSRAAEADIAGRVRETGPALPGEPPSAFGTRAQGAVVGETEQPFARATATAGAAERQAEAAGAGMPRGVSPAEAGETVEEAFSLAEKAARERIGKIYESVRRAGEKEPEIYPSNFARTAGEERDRLTGSWVSRLSPEDKPLLESILSRRSRPGAVGFRDEGMGMDNMPETLSSELGTMKFGQIANDLSLIRRAIRAASTGQGASERDELMLRRLEKSLREDRKTFFAGNKQALADIERADIEWAKAADLYDRSFVSRVLGTKGTGGALIEPENIVKQIISNPANARNAAEILSKPEYAAQRELVRGSFQFELRRAAGIGRSEALGDSPVADPKAVAKWIESRRDALQHFFSPGEIAAMGNPARLARDAARQAGTLKAVEAEFKKTLGDFKIDANDPANFFERTWATNNPVLAMKMKSIFDRRDPELSKMYAGFIHAKMDAAAIRRGNDGIERFDPAALREFFTKTDGAIEQVAVWMGPQYQRNLQLIAEAVPYMRPQGMPGVAVDTTSMELTRRARTAIFGVLSKAARVTSFFLKEAESSLSERVAMALYDPDYMMRVLERGRRTRAGASGVQAFAAGIMDIGQERSAEREGERKREYDRRK